MKYELDPHEKLPEGMKRILLECVDSVHELMRDPQQAREEAVHDARKTFKRIRAALRFARDETGRSWYRQENIFYRDSSRILAPVRDSTVLVLTLDEVTTNGAADVPAQTVDLIRRRLVQRHEDIVHDLLDEQDVMAIVARRMEDGRPRLARIPLSSTTFDVYGKGLRRVYKRGRQAMRSAFDDGHDPVRFHEWRKRVKYLWHHMELLTPAWPLILGDTGNELHNLSDFLGDAHDMVVLKETLLAEPELSKGVPDLAPLFAGIDSRRATLEVASRTLGQRLYCEKPSDFAKRIQSYWEAWQEDTPGTRTALESAVLEREQLKEFRRAVIDGTALLSTEEAAEQLGVSPEQVRNAISDGRIEASKVGRVWVVHKESLPEGEQLSSAQDDAEPVVKHLGDIVPDDTFIGTSLILKKEERFLYGIRPARLKDGRQILEFTGIGGKLEADDQSLTAGAQREALEEIGCEVKLRLCPATIIVRGERDVDRVAVRGDEQPAAVVFRNHRTPAHQPWHQDNQGEGCLVVFAAEIIGRPSPSEELPRLIWLAPEQILRTARGDVSLNQLLDGGAEMFGDALPQPADHYLARLTDSQEAIVLALGDEAYSFFQSTC